MHPVMHPLYEILKLHTRLFTNVLKELPDQIAVKQITTGSNNIGFIALHLLDARYYLAEILGAKVKNPYKDRLAEIDSVEDMKDYPNLEEIKFHWKEISEVLQRKFSELKEQDLSQMATFDFPIDDKSIVGATAFLLDHESYHIGQLGFLRRCFGYGPMSYS